MSDINKILINLNIQIDSALSTAITANIAASAVEHLLIIQIIEKLRDAKNAAASLEFATSAD